MTAFGSISVASGAGIIFGCLFFFTVTAGLIKLYTLRRRATRQSINTKNGARRMISRERLVRPHERDHFGTRELEAGDFGTIPQSRGASQNSMYVLSGGSGSVDSFQEKQAHASMSTHSSTILPTIPQQVKRKPTPLHGQLSDEEYERANYGAARNFGGSEGCYLPGSYLAPLPSPRSVRSFGSTTTSEITSGWVSSYDGNFAPSASLRPTSYLPRLQFPGDLAKNGFLMPTPPGSSLGAKSMVASIVNSDTSSARPLPLKSRDHPRYASPTQKSTLFPPISSPRGRRQGSRSIFPIYDDERPSPTHKKDLSWSRKNLPITPRSPHSYRPSKSPVLNTSVSKGTDDWNFPAVIRTFVASNHTAVNQLRRSLIQSPASVETAIPVRVVSMAASSVYSARSSTLITASQFSRQHPQSFDSLTLSQVPSRRLSQSVSSFVRTRNSVRHSREVSTDSLKRRSRDRGGSIQGQSVDFDNSRESPFSNFNVISNHSTSSPSFCSSRSSLPSEKCEPIPKPTLEANPLDQIRLDRRPSSASQGSIGDLYDSYYHPGVYRQNSSAKGTPVTKVGEPRNIGVALNPSAKKPPPFRISKMFQPDTIASPARSPMLDRSGSET